MPGYGYVLIAICVLTIGYIALCLFNKKKAYTNLHNKLIEISNDVTIVKKNKAYDFKMNYNGKLFLIKLIYNPSCDEICINAKHYWQQNHGVVSSRKKGEQMKGVYDLIFLNLEENNFPLDTVKLYIIYPNSKNLVKVINECEMVFIKPNVDIYGSRVNNYSDLEQNIDKF